MDLRKIDEEWVIENANRLWNWLGEQGERDKVAKEREQRADERHKELVRLIAGSTETLTKTLAAGFDSLARALRER